MKFKKVKIQAFRAYNKVEDGTFDFTINAEETADFVSIYAPNGFGKTSFYDAVEWGITNNLSRFLRKQSDYSLSAKAERNLASDYSLPGKAERNLAVDSAVETGQSILRNKNAPPDLEGFVEIVTTRGQTIKRKLPRARKRQADYRYNPKDTKNSYFLDVLLSQEWIDAFLKEDKAEDRYDKFIRYFGDTDSTSRYKLVVRLISRNKTQINELKKQLKDAQGKLNLNTDKEILEKINEKIKLINNQGENLREVTASFIDKDFAKFEGFVGARLIELANEVKQADEEIKIYSGQAAKINSYLGAKQEIKRCEIELKKLFKQEAAAQSRTELKNQTSNLKKDVLEQLEAKRQHEEIRNIFDDYLKIKDELTQKARLILELGDELKDRERKLESLNQRIPVVEINLNALEEKKKVLQEELSARNYSAAFDDEEVKAIGEQLIAFQTLFDNLSDEDFSSLSSFEIPNPSGLLDLIRDNLQARQAVKFKVEKINEEISKRKSLNENLKSLISLGINVAAHSHDALCPLCSYDHDTVYNLLQSIHSNSILPDSLKQLVKTKTELESEISKLDSLISNFKLKLKEEIKDQINFLESSLAEKARLNLNNRITELCEKLRILKTEREEVETTIKVLGGKIDSQQNSIQKLSDDEKYWKVLNFCENTFGQTEILPGDLEKALNKVESKILALQIAERDAAKKIEKLNKQLKSVDEEKLKTEIQERKTALSNLTETTGSFELFLSSVMKKSRFAKRESLQNVFDAAIERRKKIIEEKSKLIENYEIVEKLASSVKPFLEYHQIKNSIDNLSKQILRKKAVAAQLNAERKKLSDFINKQIEAFFYEDIINELYKKIDPHPVYRNIEFMCDFKSDRPRLEVIASNEENVIIPNLYFSTAQLNILSLSIFLAKALKATDEEGNPINCIFIDDPIQSMDNINVLSTIDLLRSIVINFGKQIILSTHDDNFHNLLKKKIPGNLFKAKYIELETVGKVKAGE